eukprot:GEMP01009055.1.p1 GENE.GEMP01009055.1~~GEMP01009055.1.p1  ORF type:complete len:774 (+),score=172.83 GEMP01009055.1:143-2464(+)
MFREFDCCSVRERVSRVQKELRGVPLFLQRGNSLIERHLKRDLVHAISEASKPSGKAFLKPSDVLRDSVARMTCSRRRYDEIANGGRWTDEDRRDVSRNVGRVVDEAIEEIARDFGVRVKKGRNVRTNDKSADDVVTMSPPTACTNGNYTYHASPAPPATDSPDHTRRRIATKVDRSRSPPRPSAVARNRSSSPLTHPRSAASAVSAPNRTLKTASPVSNRRPAAPVPTSTALAYFSEHTSAAIDGFIDRVERINAPTTGFTACADRAAVPPADSLAPTTDDASAMSSNQGQAAFERVNRVEISSEDGDESADFDGDNVPHPRDMDLRDGETRGLKSLGTDSNSDTDDVMSNSAATRTTRASMFEGRLKDQTRRRDGSLGSRDRHTGSPDRHTGSPEVGSSVERRGPRLPNVQDAKTRAANDDRCNLCGRRSAEEQRTTWEQEDDDEKERMKAKIATLEAAAAEMQLLIAKLKRQRDEAIDLATEQVMAGISFAPSHRAEIPAPPAYHRAHSFAPMTSQRCSHVPMPHTPREIIRPQYIDPTPRRIKSFPTQYTPRSAAYDASASAHHATRRKPQVTSRQPPHDACHMADDGRPRDASLQTKNILSSNAIPREKFFPQERRNAGSAGVDSSNTARDHKSLEAYEAENSVSNARGPKRETTSERLLRTAIEKHELQQNPAGKAKSKSPARSARGVVVERSGLYNVTQDRGACESGVTEEMLTTNPRLREKIDKVTKFGWKAIPSRKPSLDDGFISMLRSETPTENTGRQRFTLF